MNDEELIEITNRTITDLVYNKERIQKAYNIYNGIRDKELYQYLEDNFGIGSPTSVEFTPLVKKHVDALVGEFLGFPVLPKITCKDKDTISNITRDKELLIDKEIITYLKSHLKNQILNFISNKAIDDSSVKKVLDNLVDDINETFISQYEIAAQDILQYVMQNRRVDFKTKLKTLLLDTLISGFSYYRVVPSTNLTNINIEVLDPRNTFTDKNPESIYIKDSYRCVVRKWMTYAEILAKYGKELSKEDVDILKEEFKGLDQGGGTYMRGLEGVPSPMSEGLLARFESTFGAPVDNSSKHRYIPVYEVEWIETDDDFVMQRYETIRIGDNQTTDSFFILKGKNENVIRTKDDPNYCTLSVNGICFLNRSFEPFSLVLACEHLQNQYDVLNFFKHNLIANSGTVGDWIDISLMPSFLGKEGAERIQKWIAYKKTGIGLIDTSQDGRLSAGQANLNTTFSGFDDTIKAQAVQAIELAILSVELTCSSITGVFRERLQGIEQRDAVNNIKQGVQNSFIITKLWFLQMDILVSEMLIDILNIAKIVYKKGITGTIILGDVYLKVFTALPEYYTITDFDITVNNTSEVVQDLEQIKQMVPEFIKNGSLAPDIIFEVITCKSVTDIKKKIRKAMKKQKEENNMIQKLQELLLQISKQAEELKNQNSLLQSRIEGLNEQRIKLDLQKLQLENKVAMYKAQTERTYREDTIKNDKEKIKIEQMQLYDGNPYNDKVNMQ